MSFFFVFQNKTFNEERQGGYLWAPKCNDTGRTFSHWKKMKEVKCNDIIIHSYNARIIAISLTKRAVYEAGKPAELSDEWQQEGWRVDTEYFTFKKPIVTSEYRQQLLKLQPSKNAPFNRLGRGNTGYLFEANKQMFEFIIKQTVAIQVDEIEKQKIFDMLKEIGNSQVVISEIEIVMDSEEEKAKRLSPENLASQIIKSKAKRSQKTKKEVYYRSPYIKAMVKFLANGKCQICGQEAPFCDREERPYLEVHHVVRLADGGSDTMDNVVAACPNCHRKVHVLNEDSDNDILVQVAEKNGNLFNRLLQYTEKGKNVISSNIIERI